MKRRDMLYTLPTAIIGTTGCSRLSSKPEITATVLADPGPIEPAVKINSGEKGLPEAILSLVNTTDKMKWLRVESLKLPFVPKPSNDGILYMDLSDYSESRKENKGCWSGPHPAVRAAVSIEGIPPGGEITDSYSIYNPSDASGCYPRGNHDFSAKFSHFDSESGAQKNRESNRDTYEWGIRCQIS